MKKMFFVCRQSIYVTQDTFVIKSNKMHKSDTVSCQRQWGCDRFKLRWIFSQLAQFHFSHSKWFNSVSKLRSKSMLSEQKSIIDITLCCTWRKKKLNLPTLITILSFINSKLSNTYIQFYIYIYRMSGAKGKKEAENQIIEKMSSAGGYLEKFLGDVSKKSATKQIVIGAVSGW